MPPRPKRNVNVKIPPCPLSIWKELFAAAGAFREIEPWRWMSDSDVFGVQNPADKQIGYCCVLGALGEVLGLVVYLGTEGLEQYRKIQSGKLRADSHENVYSQTCLTAWFSNRGDLDKYDIKIASQLGLQFRGRAMWPQFRSFRPGYHPWFLNESEAKYLTLCLEQSREMALCVKSDPDWLAAPGKDQYRVRVAVESPDPPEQAQVNQVAKPLYSETPAGQQMLFANLKQNNTWQWRDQWLQPAPIPEPVSRAIPLDEVRLQRIKNISQSHAGTWEIDGYYASEAVDGDERPFFPYMMLCADHDSGFILGTVLAKPSTWECEFVEALLSAIEQSKLFPEKLSLRKEELRGLFEPLATRLGIRVEITKKLPAVDRAKREFSKFMKRRG
jgi:hypothetical protein